MIFTRHPELGIGKRRLAATIGDEAAHAVYKKLVSHTHSITEPLTILKQIWYTDQIRQNDIWDNATYEKYVQYGDDLGDRMEYAFRKAFENSRKVIIIGSDLYDISQADIKNAFKALESNDAVIGPAIDGGYYLLGFKDKLPKGVFENKIWSGPDVFEATMNDLSELETFVLPERNDIDTYEDAKCVPELNQLIEQHYADGKPTS